MHPKEWDGCFYRRTCTHDLEKWCYLINNSCIVNKSIQRKDENSMNVYTYKSLVKKANNLSLMLIL